MEEGRAAVKVTDSRVFKEFTSPFTVRLRKHNDRVTNAAEAIYQRWPDIVQDLDVNDAHNRLLKMTVCLDKNDWQGATLGDILVAARAAFDSRWIDMQLFEEFREFLIEELRFTESVGLRRVMFEIYLSTYRKHSKGTHELAKSIKKCQLRLNLKQQALIRAIPDILDPKDGPALIAQKLLAEDSPIESLSNWGLKESYDDGFMLELHFAMVHRFKPLLARGETSELSRFLAWLRPNGKSPRKKGAGEAIDAALEQWLTNTPPCKLQS